MKKSLLALFALLCVVMQGLWAQEPTPSTALEPYITSLGNRMVYKFNYPSTVAASLASQRIRAFTSIMEVRS